MHTIGIMILCIGLGLCFLTPIVHVLNRIAEGIEDMADLEAGPLADLTAVVTAAVALIDKQAAALAAAGSTVDHSAEIVALKEQLAAAVSPAAAPAAPAA